MVRTEQKKPDVFFMVEKPEYPINPETAGYQHSSITVFVSHGIPSSVSNGTFTLEYQRGYDKTINGMGHWYGETMTEISSPRIDILKHVLSVFEKMDQYISKIEKKGLRLDVSRNDDLNWRIALLKKIGAYSVDWSKEQRVYTSYDYWLKTKNQSVGIEVLS